MRIGLFTDTYLPDINGVVTSIETLKKGLEKLGHDVFVVTNQASITTTSYENRILRLPGIELKFLYGYVMSSPVHLRAVDTIKEMDLDIIHVHSEFGVGLFARSMSNVLDIPLVSTYHTTYEDYTHYVNVLDLKVLETFSKRAVAKMSRSWTQTAQVVIAPSEKTKRMLLGYGIKKEIEVIPTGLDLSDFENFDEDKVNELKHNINADEYFTFIYIGRLAKEKSVDVSIDVFSELYKNNNQIQFLIVGDGPSRVELEKQVDSLGLQESIHFLGAVPRDEVVKYYKASDAFLSASLTETQGLTYIEALASGLPVFARFDEPFEGIVLHGENGYFFEGKRDFVECALELINNRDTQLLMQKNAIAASKKFDMNVFAKKVLAVYERSMEVYHGKI